MLPLPGKQIDVSTLLTSDHNTCDAGPGHILGKVTAEAVNGDIVEFEYFYTLSFTCPPGMDCLTPYGLGDVSKAVFTRDTRVRNVESYFRAGLSCGHHTGPERFMMFFEQPLDDIRGVELSPDMQGGMNYLLTYLGQNLALISTEEVVNINWEDPGYQP